MTRRQVSSSALPDMREQKVFAEEIQFAAERFAQRYGTSAAHVAAHQ